MLIIDSVAATTDITSTGGFGTGLEKWRGGVLGPNGLIYGMPANAKSVLIIDPGVDTTDITSMGGLGTGSSVTGPRIDVDLCVSTYSTLKSSSILGAYDTMG